MERVVKMTIKVKKIPKKVKKINKNGVDKFVVIAKQTKEGRRNKMWFWEVFRKNDILCWMQAHDNMTQYQNSIQANVIINEETDTKQKTTR